MSKRESQCDHVSLFDDIWEHRVEVNPPNNMLDREGRASACLLNAAQSVVGKG